MKCGPSMQLSLHCLIAMPHSRAPSSRAPRRRSISPQLDLSRPFELGKSESTVCSVALLLDIATLPPSPASSRRSSQALHFSSTSKSIPRSSLSLVPTTTMLFLQRLVLARVLSSVGLVGHSVVPTTFHTSEVVGLVAPPARHVARYSSIASQQ